MQGKESTTLFSTSNGGLNIYCKKGAEGRGEIKFCNIKARGRLGDGGRRSFSLIGWQGLVGLLVPSPFQQTSLLMAKCKVRFYNKFERSTLFFQGKLIHSPRDTKNLHAAPCLHKYVQKNYQFRDKEGNTTDTLMNELFKFFGKTNKIS